MATKKFLELQEFSDADLVGELEATQKELNKMSFDHASSGLENPMTIRDARRDIARLKTEIRRRELANASEAELAGRSKIRFRRRKK